MIYVFTRFFWGNFGHNGRKTTFAPYEKPSNFASKKNKLYFMVVHESTQVYGIFAELNNLKSVTLPNEEARRKDNKNSTRYTYSTTQDTRHKEE